MGNQCNDINSVGNHDEVCKPNNVNIERSLPMAGSMKLFYAHSIVDDFRNHTNVKIHWFKYGNNFEGVNFKKLIVGYDELNDIERSTSEELVSELFTLHECGLLEQFLKQEHNTKLVIEEQSLPMITKDDGRTMCPTLELCYNSNSIDISSNEQYNLPFKVMGFFNFDGCLPSYKLPKEKYNDGIIFLKEALGILDFSVSQTDAELITILEKIYEKHYLYVNFST